MAGRLLTGASEKRSDLDSPPTLMSSGMLQNAAKVIAIGGLYIIVSAALIAVNKFVMHKDRFPFAVPLVLLHSGFSSVGALLLFIVRPAWFPSLTSPEDKIALDRKLLLRGALPIALLFSASLVLSNAAYQYSSMAFLQMLKESNLVLVYGFSLVLAMEAFNWDKLKVLVMIVFATTTTIHGEINFSKEGFALQGTSQLFESSKIALQALLLSSAGRKLDPLTYVLIVMPMCFCALGIVLLCVLASHPSSGFFLKIPLMSDIVAWWPALLGSAALAFALNLTIAVFLKHTSALGFIFAGVTKDVVIVVAGVFLMGESISPLQTGGFVLQLSLISLWSIMKLFPERFEEGIAKGLVSFMSPAFETKELLKHETAFDTSSSTTRYGATQKPEEKDNQC